jgi:hypothetical protein
MSIPSSPEGNTFCEYEREQYENGGYGMGRVEEKTISFSSM